MKRAAVQLHSACGARCPLRSFSPRAPMVATRLELRLGLSPRSLTPLAATPTRHAQRGKAVRKKKKTPEGERKAKDGHVTPPLKVMVKEHLTALDRTNEPLWSTFCGVSNGVWQGRMAAFYAATGEPEAVYMDGKTKIYDLHTLVVEERPDDEVITRRTLRSPKLSDVRGASLPESGLADSPADSGGTAKPPGSKDGGWESEELREGEDGLVIFDGGTFSRGPHSLIGLPSNSGSEAPDQERVSLESSSEVSSSGESSSVETSSQEPSTGDKTEPGESEDSLPSGLQASSPDYGEDDQKRTTSVIEQCLAWGGEQRIRLQLTLSAGGDNPLPPRVAQEGASLASKEAKRAMSDGELDIEVLRLALWREAWQGLTEQCAVDRCVAPDVQNPTESTSELTAAPRIGPRAFEGTWKAYDLTAVPIEDQDPVTGEVKRICLYFGQETSQRWASPQSGSGNDGAAIWLPNNILVELQMIPPSSRGKQADAAEGMQGEKQGRGFLVTFSWAVKENTVIGVHREYDANGDLLECRNRSAVQGSWVGGSM